MVNVQAFINKFPVDPHHEVAEVIVDSIPFTIFDGHTLRMDLAAARFHRPQPPKDPTGERHVVARVVLSVNAMVELINQMGHIATQLSQAGIIKMHQGKATPQGKLN